MPEQPEYCLLLTLVNEVPFIDEMVMFKPYFVIDEASNSFDVVIKVPSDCYYIVDSESAAPVDGACGSGEELEMCIDLNKQPECSETEPTLVSCTVFKPAGSDNKHMIIYTIDQANYDAVVGISKTRKKLQGGS